MHSPTEERGVDIVMNLLSAKEKAGQLGEVAFAETVESPSFPAGFWPARPEAGQLRAEYEPVPWPEPAAEVDQPAS